MEKYHLRERVNGLKEMVHDYLAVRLETALSKQRDLLASLLRTLSGVELPP